MCCLRHPQYRWDDRRIQLRPNHSTGGNSEGETEDISPSSNTPRDKITSLQFMLSSPHPHLRRHQEQCQPQHVRHYLHGLKTRKQKDQGTPEPMFLTQETASRQRQLLVRANIKAHTQPRYNGSQTFSANRRNS